MATYPRCVYILKSRGTQAKENSSEKEKTPEPAKESSSAPAGGDDSAMDVSQA